MLTLNTLLVDAGLPPSETLVARHVPKEPSIKRLLPLMIETRPDLFRMFQSIQGEPLEKAMTKARYLASFLGDRSGNALFSGIYSIGSSRRISSTEYAGISLNAELIELGMMGWGMNPETPFYSILSSTARCPLGLAA